jgi:hypothetical protein
MQKGQASISRVKPTDRESDAARTEISFNIVAYHHPWSTSGVASVHLKSPRHWTE